MKLMLIHIDDKIRKDLVLNLVEDAMSSVVLNSMSNPNRRDKPGEFLKMIMRRHPEWCVSDLKSEDFGNKNTSRRFLETGWAGYKHPLDRI